MTASKKDVACSKNTVQAWREHLFFEPRNMVSEYSSYDLIRKLTVFFVFLKHTSAISEAVIEMRIKNKGIFKD